MKNKKAWVITGVVVVILLLLVWAKIFNKNPEISISVPCLNGNSPLLQHIHPNLKIMVAGEEEIIPSDIGLPGGVGATNCEHALHTHDASGQIHVEAQDLRDYTLGQFFEVWGKAIMRPGYSLTMTVDGKPSSELGNLVLKDGQQIVLTYTK